MKRKQVNDFFKEDAKRHKKIVSYIVFIVNAFIISILFMIMFIKNNKVQYVKYDEKSNVEYNVMLKDNSFYKSKNQEKNHQYISELIDYIKANFKYDLALKRQNVEYKYSYYIEANVSVVDKQSKKSLYEYNEILMPLQELSSTEEKVSIDEFVNINYNKYNDLISDFIRTYKLDYTENMLKINLYVDVIGSCEEFTKNTSNETITSLEIPLTNKTIGIDITNNLVNNTEKIMYCGGKSSTNNIYLILSIVLFIIAIILLVRILTYIKNTRSAKTKYEIELKRILSNYRSYIQKINSKFDIKQYQPLKVDSFTDMLEIRETTNQPILMVENGEKNSVYFIIPTATKILYMYKIKVSDYENETEAKELKEN